MTHSLLLWIVPHGLARPKKPTFASVHLLSVDMGRKSAAVIINTVLPFSQYAHTEQFSTLLVLFSFKVQSWGGVMVHCFEFEQFGFLFVYHFDS